MNLKEVVCFPLFTSSCPFGLEVWVGDYIICGLRPSLYAVYAIPCTIFPQGYIAMVGNPLKGCPFFFMFLKQFMNFFASKLIISKPILAQCLHSTFGVSKNAYFFISYSPCNVPVLEIWHRVLCPWKAEKIARHNIDLGSYSFQLFKDSSV